MPFALYLLAFAAGVVLIVQVGVNTSGALGAPVVAALISFLIGSVALVAFLVLSRTTWPARAQWAATPWWAWFAGILGAFYVVSTIMAGPRLGAAALLALIVLGQLWRHAADRAPQLTRRSAILRFRRRAERGRLNSGRAPSSSGR